jgi:hypothetical protein
VPQVQYAKSEGGSLKFVICVIDEQGREEFKQRDLGDEQWSRCAPSEEERSIAHQLLQQAAADPVTADKHVTYQGRGNLYIDWCR